MEYITRCNFLCKDSHNPNNARSPRAYSVSFSKPDLVNSTEIKVKLSLYCFQVDGKTLCLLCTLSYKRILYKTKKGEKRPSGKDHKRDRKDRRTKIAKTENNDSPKDGKPGSAAAAALERIGSARNSPLTIALYSSMANDASSEPIALESHITELTELKEQVVNLKKQLQQKDQALIEKEKKLTELKADHWEKEKELRQKMVQMQKQQVERIEGLQTENRNLKKQIATLSKGKDKPLTTSG